LLRPVLLNPLFCSIFLFLPLTCRLLAPLQHNFFLSRILCSYLSYLFFCLYCETNSQHFSFFLFAFLLFFLNDVLSFDAFSYGPTCCLTCPVTCSTLPADPAVVISQLLHPPPTLLPDLHFRRFLTHSCLVPPAVQKRPLHFRLLFSGCSHRKPSRHFLLFTEFLFSLHCFSNFFLSLGFKHFQFFSPSLLIFLFSPSHHPPLPELPLNP